MKKLKEMEVFESLLATPENELVKKAIADGRHAIGYNCYCLPMPVLEMGSLFPVRLRAQHVESTEDGNYYLGAWLCSYSRAVVQALINGDYAFLDGMLGTLSCVHISRAVQHEKLLGLSKKENFFWDMLDIPRKEFDKSRGAAIDNMRQAAKKLGETYGVDTSDKALNKAIHEHNEFTKLLKSVGDLRLADKPKITGTEWATVMTASLVAPRDLLIEPLKALKKALDARTPDRASKVRIMVAGAIFDNPDYVKLVEDQGCYVVADRYCFGSMPGLELIPEDTSNPYETLFNQYLVESQCPRMMEKSEDRFDYIKGKIEEYKCDGVVFETMRFCDLWGYEGVVNYKRLQDEKIPIVRIDREYLISGEGQFNTRVQAFVERIAAKKLV